MYDTDTDGRVVMQAAERSFVDVRTADGHVYRQDADRLVRAWPFHVNELIGHGLRPYTAPAPAADEAPSVDATAKAKKG